MVSGLIQRTVNESKLLFHSGIGALLRSEFLPLATSERNGGGKEKHHQLLNCVKFGSQGICTLDDVSRYGQLLGNMGAKEAALTLRVTIVTEKPASGSMYMIDKGSRNLYKTGKLSLE